MLEVMPWAETVEVARLAASEGYYCAWFDDDRDPLAYAAALAQAVPDIRIGLMAERLRDRPPVLRAKQLVTLDHVTDGRLIVGVESRREALSLIHAFAGPYNPGPLQKPHPPLWVFGRDVDLSDPLSGVTRALFSVRPTPDQLEQFAADGIGAVLSAQPVVGLRT